MAMVIHMARGVVVSPAYIESNRESRRPVSKPTRAQLFPARPAIHTEIV